MESADAAGAPAHDGGAPAAPPGVPASVLLRGTGTKRPKGLSRAAFLATVTNLNLEDSELTTLRGVVAACPRLRSLYAPRNALATLADLDPTAAADAAAAAAPAGPPGAGWVDGRTPTSSFGGGGGGGRVAPGGGNGGAGAPSPLASLERLAVVHNRLRRIDGLQARRSLASRALPSGGRAVRGTISAARGRLEHAACPEGVVVWAGRCGAGHKSRGPRAGRSLAATAVVFSGQPA